MLVGQSSKKLEDLAKELSGDIEIYALDSRSALEVKAMVEKTISRFNQIDSVIQNVAIYPWKLIEELSLEEWQQTLDTNLTSAFITTKACFAEMKSQRNGKFVFMSSAAGEIMGMPFMGAYSASKAGLNGFMRTAAIEFSKYNITANSISPGKMYNEHTLTEKERKNKLLPIPLKRFINPIDVAEMAFFLISEKAKNITGQNFIIDGGQSILGEDSHLN